MMRHLLLIVLSICMAYPSFAQNTITHTLQVGDTLASLAETYDTCREAIIYENDLTLTGMFSAYYRLETGTILTIPPRSTCDILPTGKIYHTVMPGETTASLFAKYRYPQAQMTQVEYGPQGNSRGEILTPITADRVLVGGEVLIVYPAVPFYSTTQELLVTDDTTQFEFVDHSLQTGNALASLVEIYQPCRDGTVWKNQVSLPHVELVAYILDTNNTLLAPPVILK
jgi:hypothetical protein